MASKKLSWVRTVGAVLYKDLACECRAKHTFGTVLMFALVALTVITMGLGGISLTSALAAVLLWVVIFFSAMAGLSRSFGKEMETGTLFTLKLYAGAQSVLFGKLLFNFLIITVLTAIIAPLFVLFFNIEALSWTLLVVTLLLGGFGIATVSTLTAAIAAGSDGNGALFTVITFPLLVPLLLTAIQLTDAIFAGFQPIFGQVMFLIGYDVAVLIAASVLFDFLW